MHPTPPSLPVSAGQQERWWGCCACGCTGTWTLLSHPTPPNPTPPHPTITACVCRTARKMMRLLCLWVHGNMNVIIPPHPTPPHRSLILKDHCLCLQDSKKDDEVAVPVGAREHERYYHTPPHPTPPHPTTPRCASEWFSRCVSEWISQVRKWVNFQVRKWVTSLI